MAQPADHRSFEAPDEVRQLPNGRAEVVKIAVRDRAVGLRARRPHFAPQWARRLGRR